DLLLDAAAFLGPGPADGRGLLARRRADDAGRRRTRPDQAPQPPLHGDRRGRQLHPLPDARGRARLPGGSDRARPRLPHPGRPRPPRPALDRPPLPLLEHLPGGALPAPGDRAFHGMKILRLHLASLRAAAGSGEAAWPVHGFVLLHERAGPILADTGVGGPDAWPTDSRAASRAVGDAPAEHRL